MLIPMEVLSFTKTRTDSGSGVQPRPGSGVENNSSRFERMFEQELTKHESRIIEKALNSEDDGQAAKPVIEQDKDNTEETLAAGVMGNLLNKVIIILEGDSESVTPPEIRVESTEPPDTNQIVNPESENEKEPEIITTQSNENVQENVQTAGAINAVNTETTKPITANTEPIGENNTNATGEVMARMPEIKTQDRQENTENNSKNSETGNLSPLENENDTQVKGQKDKTYSETADAVKSAAENKPEATTTTVNEIPPPLSEGIRPEQFRAAQQMTEAALSTPVKTENLFQEMISRVEMMQNETKSTMTIQLNPEFLGKVALEVAVDAAGLHVKINAEDSGVRSMINGQLTTLIESLENKGIAVVEVEVAYTGINYGTFQDPREGGQQQNKQQHTTKRETNNADGVTYYTAVTDLLDYYLDTGVSSVEYRA